MDNILDSKLGRGFAITVGSFLSLVIAFASYQSITSRASMPAIVPTPLEIQLEKSNVLVDQKVTKALTQTVVGGKPKTTTVLIYMQKPPKLTPVTSSIKEQRIDERTTYVDDLRRNTGAIQDKVRSSLSKSLESKDIVIKKSFFIDNIFLADVTEQGLTELKQTPGVSSVIPDGIITLPPLTKIATTQEQWNISKINADRVWNELGITGQGVVVANIDSGVQWNHPALKNQYRGFDGTNTDHNYNWYDPSNTSPLTPLDNTNHGTHTMGTMVGFDGTTHIGVAPGAKWIAAKGCATNFCSSSDLLSAGQWMLAPTKLDGTNPDPSKAPDVVNNSWGGGGCNTIYKGVLEAWRNAGIVPIFSAGNSGPNASTVGSPGDNPEAISIGATDISDNIASFSSRGPACGSFGGITKPDVSAPGVAVYSSIPNNGYATFNGTSMAAPHVAGLVALLLQSKPNLTVYEVEQILKRSATDLGSTGTDNTFGAGLINAFQALQIDPVTIPSPTPTPTPAPITPTLTPTPTIIKKITLISPNLATPLAKGSLTPIQWTSTGISGVDIINLDGYDAYNRVFSQTIQTNRGANDSFLWNVSTYNLDLSPYYAVKYKIRVVGGFPAITDSSDQYFTIVSPTPTPTNTPTPTPPTPFLKVLQPSGDETLFESQQYPITWSSNLIGTVSIYLMKEDGLDGTPLLATVPANQQSYLWSVSKNIFTNASRFKIWIHDNINGGQSNAFTILPMPTPTNTPTPTPTPIQKPSQVAIFAAGSQTDGMYPSMLLRLNGSLVGRWNEVRGNPYLRLFNKYTVTLPRKIQPSDKLQIHYRNGDTIGGRPRGRLRIDKITVDNIIYQAESPTVFTTGGPWSDAINRCTPGFIKSEWFRCSGYVEFSF